MQLERLSISLCDSDSAVAAEKVVHCGHIYCEDKDPSQPSDWTFRKMGISLCQGRVVMVKGPRGTLRR